MSLPRVLQQIECGLRHRTSLWLVDLDARALDELDLGLLDDSERARAGRFVFERDARRFVACRLALRHLLSPLAAAQPADLRFETGRYGKPRLDHPGAIHFNVSHSGPFGLIAVCPTSPLGVDIEQWRDMPDAADLAARNFTRAEQAELEAVPAHARSLAFLRGWTRKEACIKAVGSGLSIEPDTFEAGLAAALRHVDVPGPEAGRHAVVEVVSLDLPGRQDTLPAAVAWTPVSL